MHMLHFTDEHKQKKKKEAQTARLHMKINWVHGLCCCFNIFFEFTSAEFRKMRNFNSIQTAAIDLFAVEALFFILTADVFSFV